MADEVIASLEAGWRNSKHKAQWRNTLTAYCASIRDIPVDAVTAGDILDILKPIWSRVPATASRLRGPHREDA